MKEEFRSGFISVIGRPNVGKSSLINRLIRARANIVTDKPQTTRQSQRAILTEDDFQAIFLDTPGVHKIKNKLDEHMYDEIKESLGGIDLIFFVCDAGEGFGPGDEFIFNRISDSDLPRLLILNKVDLLDKEELAEISAEYAEKTGLDLVEVSSKTGQGIDELRTYLRKNLPEGPQYYPEDMYVDRRERDMVAEFIREQIFRLTWAEVPYGTAVMIEEMEEKEDITYIRANIYVEQKSHRGMVIGEDGRMLKKIGRQARAEIEDMLGRKVYLDLWVKDQKNWRKDKTWLERFGYE